MEHGRSQHIQGPVAARCAGEQDVKWQETTEEVEAVKQTDISSKTHCAPGNGKPWGFRQGSNMTRRSLGQR